MKIKIFCFNKMNKEFLEIYRYYVQKLSKFTDIEVVEVNEFVSGDIKSNMTKNEDNLEKKIVDCKDFEFYLLDISGKQYPSEKFAELLITNQDFKNAKLAFIIGPSDGFSAEFRAKFSQKLSFGIPTFPYNLIRIILLEQIYRGFKINRNEPYHK